jgi:iron complex transport system substrate-binding protein
MIRDMISHAAVLAAALALGITLALPSAPSASTEAPAAGQLAPVVDARGRPVRAGGWRRIGSLSLVADSVLAEIASPEQVVLTTTWLDADHPLAFRLPDRPRVLGAGDVEAILAARPELVLVGGERDAARLARLEEAGVVVFDLGEHGGVDSLWASIDAVARLLGAPERGAALIARLRARLDALPQAPTDPPRALYLSAFGTTLYGGALGTSYHDLLTHAGLRDVAAEAGLHGWPPLTVEAALAMRPEILVLERGTSASFCATEAGGTLCDRARVVELPPKQLHEPGVGLIDAIEALAAAVTPRG